MNASTKGNGSGFSLPKWVLIIIAVGLFVGGAIAGTVAGLSRTNGRADVTYADLVDERIEHLTTQLETLTTAVDQHVRLDMHPGAKAVVAEMRGTLERLDKGMERIERKLEKLEDK